MLVTLLLDYNGGTYVSQVEVQILGELPARLFDAFDWSAVHPSPSPSMLSRFIRSLADSSPSKVSELRQVWCMTGILGSTLAIIHIVNTAVSTDPGA